MKKIIFIGILLGSLSAGSPAFADDDKYSVFDAADVPYNGFIGIMEYGYTGGPAVGNLCSLMEWVNDYQGTQKFNLPQKCLDLRHGLEERKKELENNPKMKLTVETKKYHAFGRILQQMAKESSRFLAQVDPTKNKKALLPAQAGFRFRGQARWFSATLETLQEFIGINPNSSQEYFLHIVAQEDDSQIPEDQDDAGTRGSSEEKRPTPPSGSQDKSPYAPKVGEITF
ncbi:MAG: hypothetical protein AAB091_02090 [Elusimicrobiota bacterium]